MNTNNCSLSLVLPAYNESGNIEKTVAEAVSYLKEFGDYEIVVVNDGSVDDTAKIVERLSFANPKIVLASHQVNQGYGAALRTGFDRASLDYIMLMDSDGQFDIRDAGSMVPYLDTYDVVIGYREMRADLFIRALNQRMYHIFIRLLFGLNFRDIDCAFKIFPKSIYQRIRPIKSGGALFSAEFLIKLKQNNFKIKEIPVNHFPRRFGSSTGANISVIMRMFKECWKLRNELKGKPE